MLKVTQPVSNRAGDKSYQVTHVLNTIQYHHVEWARSSGLEMNVS